MSQGDTPILVVDDAKFSSAIIAKALRGGGFNNVRFTNNPLQALRSLEKRPAEIVIADWLMPTMDGLELTRRVKKLDDSSEHFTYVMLLTARDDPDAIDRAFEAGVDDFLNKANLRGYLLQRVISAQRLSDRHNGVLKTNRLLRRRLRDMQTTDLVDPVTGLGNLRFTLERLSAATKDAEARGGAAGLMLVGINNLDTIEEQFDQSAIDEVMTGLSSKLRQLVRPLDILTRPEPNVFAVIMRFGDTETYNAQSFRRVFDNLYMHSFKTSAGFIPIVVGVSLCAVDTASGFPEPKPFIQACYESLTKSFETGIITMTNFDATSIRGVP